MSLEQAYSQKLALMQRVLKSVDNVFHLNKYEKLDGLFVNIKMTGGKEAIKIHIEEKISGVFFEFANGNFSFSVDKVDNKIGQPMCSIDGFTAKYKDVIENIDLFWQVFKDSGVADKFVDKCTLNVTKESFVVGKYKTSAQWSADVIVDLIQNWEDITLEEFAKIKISSSPRSIGGIYDEYLRKENSFSQKTLNNYINLLYGKNLLPIIPDDFKKVAYLVGKYDIFTIKNVELWFANSFERVSKKIENNDVNTTESKDLINSYYRHIMIMGGAKNFTLNSVKTIERYVNEVDIKSKNLTEVAPVKIVTFNNDYWIKKSNFLVFKQQDNRSHFYPLDNQSVSKLYGVLLDIIKEHCAGKYISYQEIAVPPSVKEGFVNSSFLLFVKDGFEEDELLEDMGEVVEIISSYLKENPMRENSLFNDINRGKHKEFISKAILKNLLQRNMSHSDDLLAEQPEDIAEIKL